MEEFIPQKTIRIPPSVLVDVSGMLPIIHTEYFQKLIERKQLGLAYKVYPGGTHTRFEHSLGTLHITRKIIRHFKMADQELTRALEVYALLHDVGHGPFSHEIEPVLRSNHKERGAIRIQEMEEEISQYADYDLVLKLFQGKDPFCQIVRDKNFGADKIDYLQRDALHVGYELGLNTETIIKYLQYQAGYLGVDEKSKEEIMAYQFSFLRMYIRIYMQKTVKIFARMFQRALTEYLEKGHDEESIWEMTDADIKALLSGHSLMNCIRNRKQLKTAAVFKIDGYEKEERVGNRGYPVYGIEPNLLLFWSKQIDNPKFLLKLEKQLEAALGLERDNLIIVQPNFYEKLIPKDVLLYRKGKGEFESLFEQVTSHPISLKEMADRAFYIRVAIVPDFLATVRNFNFKNFFGEQI